MKRSLVSADRLASLAKIAGSHPRGEDPEVGAALRRAIDTSPDARLSFAGVRRIGDDFIVGCLAPVLFAAARAGTPVLATELDREVARCLHSRLGSIGALLHHAETDMALGASPNLVNALAEIRDGKRTAGKLAAALGISEIAAAGRIRVLSHWGLIASAAHGRDSVLPIAA